MKGREGGREALCVFVCVCVSVCEGIIDVLFICRDVMLKQASWQL